MIYLPYGVEEQLVRERQAADAELALLAQTSEQLRHAREFNKELRAIDPYLELVFIKGNGRTPQEAPDGVVWDRWHVIRHNPGAPDTPMAITTPDGGPREPDSGVLRELREGDMYNATARARVIRRRAKRAEDKQRAKDARREEDREEVAWRIKAIMNPGVNFGIPGWTRTAGARHGRTN